MLVGSWSRCGKSAMEFLSEFSKDWVTRIVMGNILRPVGCKPRELKDTYLGELN